MKDPALILLYGIPVLVNALGGFLWVKSVESHYNYDSRQAIKEMAADHGGDFDNPSAAEAHAWHAEEVNNQRDDALNTLGGGVALF